jgi:hypothetical protein
MGRYGDRPHVGCRFVPSPFPRLARRRLNHLPSVPQLKPHNWRKRFACRRGRELSDFPACFADRVIHNGIPGALHNGEFFDRAIPLDFQLYGGGEFRSKAHFTSWLVPGCIETAAYDLRIGCQSVIA